MKAAICTQYGPPEVLQIKEVPKPALKLHQILVEIKATAVNSGDVKIRGLAVNGFQKLLIKLALGFSKPRKPILGNVFAGLVFETGPNTSKFKKGDKVFGLSGFQFGTYAEYIALNEQSILEIMPENASFEEAAALPFGWHTALHFFDKSGLPQNAHYWLKALSQNTEENTPSRPHILIYGGAGSVGTAAIQWAQYLKAELTVICSSESASLMEKLGVKNVLFYDQTDFIKNLSQGAKKFDFIFDAVGKTSKKACRDLLHPKAKFLTVGGMDMASEKIPHFQIMKRLFEDGNCTAIIDKIYPFENIVEAHRYVDSGRKKGNVILSFGSA